MRNFIIENEISFDEGQRNSSVVTLIGYAQHLGMSRDKLKNELNDEITKDIFIGQEIDRLYRYCEDKNYKSFWRSPEAKLQYIY
ncbi:MAG: hypothetical protein AABY22_10285 [Nanoarchaeota archaeon]